MGPRNLLATGTALQTLGLAVMAGGMLALGAFTAPVIFRHFDALEAGKAMGVVFTRFDMALLVALALVAIGEVMRFFSGRVTRQGWLAVGRYVLLAALSLMLLYSTLKVNADLWDMNQAGIRPDASPLGLAFARMHKLSEQLYKAEMTFALLLILLTPFVPETKTAP